MNTDKLIKILVVISTILGSIAVVLKEFNKTSATISKISDDLTNKILTNEENL